MDDEQRPRPELPPPGWFPDPFDAAAWRWWDGHAWSPHSSPRAESATPGVPVAPRGVPLALEAEIRSARFARIAVVVWAAVLIVIALTAFSHVPTWSQILHAIHTANQTGNSVVYPQQSAWSVLEVFNIPAAVFFLIWQFRSAVVARALGYPTRRTPGWGVALWFVPIVNWWMPYQALRDLLRPGSSERKRVLLLWLAYVISQPLAAVALFPGARPFAVAFDIVAAALFAAIGPRLVTSITEQHRMAVTPSGSSSARSTI